MKVYSSIVSPEDTIRKIYNGEVFLLNENTSSRLLAEYIFNLIRAEFKSNCPENSESKYLPRVHYRKIQSIRREILIDQNIPILINNLLVELNFNRIDFNVDNLRLRAITTNAHKIEEAKPAFYPHRDTWYGNKESQLNIWIPLSDISKKNSFAFYPDYFTKSILNDSDLFNSIAWKESGFQNAEKENYPKIYPKPKESLEFKKKWIPEMKKNSIFIFSAHHLHGTLENKTNNTRFSTDFRIVPQILQDSIPPNNLDNFSFTKI